MTSKTPLIGMTLEQLQQVATNCSLPKFAAGQIARWLYQKRATDIDQMTDISLEGRKRLKENYIVGLEKPLLRTVSVDGTVKYLFTGVGGRAIEAVMIPDADRATLCISSQAGCKMNCKFCVTGRQGFHGNLPAWQIMNQIMAVDESQQLTNIVFMGMGEPTDNLEAVEQVIEVMTAKWGFAWSPKRITLSSIGKVDALKHVIDTTQVHIALSLHSPFAQQRSELMPVEKAYPLTSVLDMIRSYDWSHQRRFSVEYIVWKGVNDSLRYADALARLLKGIHCRVNLIRFHEFEGSDLRTASLPTIEAFRDRLNQLGVTATIRASRGEDIMAACGMLAGKNSNADNATCD